MKSRAAQPLSDIAARMAISLQYPNPCTACWPFPKYTDPGDTRVSAKRGIAITNAKLSVASLQSLSRAVSWGYGWDYKASPAVPSVRDWDAAGVRWMPMVWGSAALAALTGQIGTLDWGASPRAALLGFNEPNFASQANLSPAQAAQLWPQVQQLASRYGVVKLVSPAVTFNPAYQGIDWLKEFIRLCVNCRIDAIAIHSYTCYARFLRDHLDIYRVLGKKMWLTEFACADPAAISASRLSAAGQMAFMREAIPLLEQDPDVEMYAWFSFFQNEWPSNVATTGDAGLVNSDGSLSELGKLYATFRAGDGMQS